MSGRGQGRRETAGSSDSSTDTHATDITRPLTDSISTGLAPNDEIDAAIRTLQFYSGRNSQRYSGGPLGDSQSRRTSALPVTNNPTPFGEAIGSTRKNTGDSHRKYKRATNKLHQTLIRTSRTIWTGEFENSIGTRTRGFDQWDVAGRKVYTRFSNNEGSATYAKGSRGLPTSFSDHKLGPLGQSGGRSCPDTRTGDGSGMHFVPQGERSVHDVCDCAEHVARFVWQLFLQRFIHAMFIPHRFVFSNQLICIEDNWD